MDITKCKGDGCLLSLNCIRFTAEPSMYQSYFTDAPYRVVNGKTECEYFWNTKEETDEERGIGEIEPNGIEEIKQDTGNGLEKSS